MGLKFFTGFHRDGFKCFLLWTLTIFALVSIIVLLSLPPWNRKAGRIAGSYRDHSSFSKFKQGDPAFNLSLNPNHKLIILLTSFRGGSSFLGTLFDINPKIQYFYEPFEGGHLDHLYKTGKLIGARSDHTSSDQKMLYLQQILHNCTVYGTPFPEKHEFCGTPAEQLHRLNATTCSLKGWRNGASHQEICRYRKFTVLKLIRMPVLADILKISQIRSANIYVIHLLRHPSPLIMSRRTGGMFFMWRHADLKSVERGKDEEMNSRITWEAFNYCHENMKSAEFAKSQPWLRGRYLQVTHTEMSVKPLETARKIYDFVNETLTSEVKDYITSITDGFGESDQARETSRGEKTKMKKDPLEVRKNSSEVVETWKKFYTRVYYRDVMSVESQCRSIFELLRGDSFTVDRLPTNKLSKILNL